MTTHEWSHLTGLCRLCGDGIGTDAPECAGYAGEPEDAWEALARMLVSLEGIETGR